MKQQQQQLERQLHLLDASGARNALRNALRKQRAEARLIE